MSEYLVADIDIGERMGLLISIKALGDPRKGELERVGGRETSFEGLCY